MRCAVRNNERWKGRKGAVRQPRIPALLICYLAQITSAGSISDTASRVTGGTSMSSPLVAGVLAMYASSMGQPAVVSPSHTRARARAHERTRTCRLAPAQVSAVLSVALPSVCVCACLLLSLSLAFVVVDAWATSFAAGGGGTAHAAGR